MTNGEPLTIERIIEIGLGHMGFDPISFFEMTIADFELALRGFHELNEIREREQWERTRWLATLLLQPHTAKNKTIKPTDVCVFPWEEKKRERRDGESLLKSLMK